MVERYCHGSQIRESIALFVEKDSDRRFLLTQRDGGV
jgi:hypothetical protein